MTPKQQFLKTQFAAVHGDLINNDHFRAAVNFAKLQMLDELPATYDPAKGWDSHSQMQGVLKFLDIFSRLHIEEKEPKPLDMPKLNTERFKQPKMP